MIINDELGYTIFSDLPGFLNKYRAFPLSGDVRGFDSLEEAEKYCIEMYVKYIREQK